MLHSGSFKCGQGLIHGLPVSFIGLKRIGRLSISSRVGNYFQQFFIGYFYFRTFFRSGGFFHRCFQHTPTAVASQAAPTIRGMIDADIKEARRLDKAADRLAFELESAGDKLAQSAIEKLYADTRRVLDKAKLGKIDAVIGQKRKLDIEVQDLAAGRFPEELIGRMWNASMIGDDEEYWPWQGEFWADEYEGWR